MKKTLAPLVEAATRLEDSLAAYEHAAHEVLKQTLDSRRNVNHAVTALAEITGLGEEMGAGLKALVTVIGELRERQQTSADAVQKRAAEVVERKAALDALLERQALLGDAVKAVGELFDAVRKDPTQLDDALERIGKLTELAQGFAMEAQTQSFPDLVAEGQALRQQLLNVKSKAGLLKDRVPKS